MRSQRKGRGFESRRVHYISRKSPIPFIVVNLSVRIIANVDDIHGISTWYQSAMNRLQRVSPVNKKLILQFLSKIQKQGVTLNTRASRLNILIRMDLHFQKPLTEITETDFDAFLSELELKGYKPGYIANYQKSFKKAPSGQN